MNNKTPTPRTDKVVSSDMGDSGFIVDLIKHSQQLERELNESQLWVKASMESASIASATIARLETERDQLMKVCDDFANLIRNVRPIVREDGSREDWIDCQIDEILRDYNSLPHVIAKGKTK